MRLQFLSVSDTMKKKSQYVSYLASKLIKERDSLFNYDVRNEMDLTIKKFSQIFLNKTHLNH